MARRSRRSESNTGESLGGDFWAVAFYLVGALFLATLAIAALPNAPRSDVDTLVTPISRSSTAEQAWRGALRALCRNPTLSQLALTPNCETGSLALLDEQFFVENTATLTDAAKLRLRAAVPAFLETLRRRPRAWNLLEAIELRGHADPRAVRDPYRTNLVASQARALSILIFLTTEGVLSDPDRADLERLALASGASYSRPPASCADETARCYRVWRRVELRPRRTDRVR